MAVGQGYCPFFINDPVATELAIDYTSIAFISLLFSVYSFVFVGFYTGIEKTKLHMTVTITSNIINLYLNAALIYGSGGIETFFQEVLPQVSFLSILWKWTSFPALGVKGAAIATLIASGWMVFHYSVFLFSKDIKNRFNIFSVSIDKSNDESPASTCRSNGPTGGYYCLWLDHVYENSWDYRNCRTSNNPCCVYNNTRLFYASNGSWNGVFYSGKVMSMGEKKRKVCF